MSLQWLELSQTCLRWDRSRSCWGGSLVLQSWRRVTVEVLRIRFLRWISPLDAVIRCCQRFCIEAASVLTVVFIWNLFVVSSMVKSINYFWVLPTLSIRGKGKRFTSDCWIVSRFSVRWSSSSTILTLMAWRCNILQKSFVRDCSSLLKNDLRFTRRWQSLQLAVACCAFCALCMCYQKCLNFAVLKVLPSGDW